MVFIWIIFNMIKASTAWHNLKRFVRFCWSQPASYYYLLQQIKLLTRRSYATHWAHCTCTRSVGLIICFVLALIKVIAFLLKSPFLSLFNSYEINHEVSVCYKILIQAFYEYRNFFNCAIYKDKVNIIIIIKPAHLSLRQTEFLNFCTNLAGLDAL